MRKADFPFLPDLLTLALRWLTLVALTAVQALAGAPAAGFLLALAAACAWNLFLSILAVANSRLPAHRPLSIAVDLLLSAAFFYASGGLGGALAWAGVLAILSAAMYYEWRGALVSAALVTLLEGGLAVWMIGAGGLSAYLLPAGILISLNLAVGAVLGLLSRRVMRLLRQRYRSLLALREETERIAQMKERKRLQVFYSMVETLSATLNYEIVLDSALNLSISALGEENESTRLVSAVLLFENSRLVIAEARGLSPADRRVLFTGEQGALAEALKSGQAQMVTNPAGDPELGRLLALQSCRAALCLPLRRGLDAYGAMLFAYPDPAFFTSERRDLLEMIGHQVVVSMQNARLFQEVEQEKDRILTAQEETRKKLARDLHDGPTQLVAGIAMRLQVASRLLRHRPAEVPEELKRIEELARRATQEIRHMLFTLRPLALESEGLVCALEQMSDKMKETFQQNVVLELDPQAVQALDLNRQSVVFYLVEEAVNNARKHAQASLIRVRLRPMPEEAAMLLLEIADNGKGFDVAGVNHSYEKRGSLGMVNLRERAEMINAALRIQSAPGKGTRVQAIIPLDDGAVDRLQRGLARSANPN
ncbi:MAG: GAF domain-containing sensor histidine kinase [Bellilinea sp.]